MPGNAMMVAIDGTPAVRPVLTGTELYARRIIEALAASATDHRLRVYANAVSAPAWLPGSVEWRGIPFPRAWTHWRLRRALLRDQPDVTFIPSHVLPVGLRLPSVVTIHDVGHRHERSSYSPLAWWYLELTTRDAARRASRLIAVSQSTADDLARFYRVAPERVTVIHSGVDRGMAPPSPDRVAAVRRRFGLGDPYFLFVGRNHPRKNLPLLRRAFAEARRRGLGAQLVLAGPWHDRATPGEGVVVLPYVPVDELPALYAGAIALTLPSRFEGFGFPVLEAMRCATAVITSRAGALPEIVDAAGMLLDAGDEEGWTAAMLELASNQERRRQLVEAGVRWSERFTWETAARKTWRVLELAGGAA